ncbi:Neurotrophin 1 like protein [Argiope bruennichi]|uniref:Neurotrophin 1 like protein n=1 Tax=Argiope bruennichi TaxID=94029 RepID=A0A8T0E0V4_ARGBR|nr:Neurotrophin 1 like protein [Argiope bruennichi]
MLLNLGYGWTIFLFTHCILVASENLMPQAEPLKSTPPQTSLSNMTNILEEESKMKATWIFLDKPPEEALNEEKLIRMANWVSQVTALPPVGKYPNTKRQETAGTWEQGPESEMKEPAGSKKPPGCAQYGRYYCSYKEDYPIDVVSQVIKYMKWPLEKLFRDLKHQRMPRIAENADGALVCDSITRMIRPGWAKNNNGRWVVVINTEQYAQFVTEVICRYDNSYCNFVPPCYQATCQQRYNTQTLLAIDPYNPHKGPFLSKFLFPSCCVCYVPKVKFDKGSDDY